MSELEDLQTRFDWELVRVSDMASRRDFGGAVAALQDFWELHQLEDRDGGLERAVRFHQASFLRMAGDLAGALQLFRTVHPEPGDRFFYLLTAYCVAAVLDGLGERREAFEELQRRLSEAVAPPRWPTSPRSRCMPTLPVGSGSNSPRTI